MRQSRAERRLDGSQRGFRLRSIGTTGLRHIRPAAAAFAAERLGALAGKVDSIETRNKVVGDTNDDAGLAIAGNADDSDHTGADLFLALIGEAAQVFQFDAFYRARHQLDVANRAQAVGAIAFAGTASRAA